MSTPEPRLFETNSTNNHKVEFFVTSSMAEFIDSKPPPSSYPEQYLPPRSQEERYVLVLERRNTNARYRCPFCQHNYSGGNQKIRVHITGVREGGTSVRACTNPSPEALEFCRIPRKPYKRKEKSDGMIDLGDMEDNEDVEVKDMLKKRKIEPPVLSDTEAAQHEAWNILHEPSKHVQIDDLAVPDLQNPRFNPSITRLLNEYGVERSSDLGLLDPTHLICLANNLKVVPRKVFLNKLNVTVNVADQVPPQQVIHDS